MLISSYVTSVRTALPSHLGQNGHTVDLFVCAVRGTRQSRRFGTHLRWVPSLDGRTISWE